MTSKPSQRPMSTTTPRKLVLYSNHSAPHHDALDARMLRLIDKHRPRIAYIPAETVGSEEDFEKTHRHYAQLGANLATFFDPGTEPGPIDWSGVLACDAIHLSGGNTFAFLVRLRRWHGIEVLRDYVARGGVLIGVSAGAILMGPSAEPGLLTGDLPESDAMDKSAMSLVDFHFWPHFDPARRLSSGQRRLLQRLHHLHACPDGAGIVVDGASIEIFGDVEVTEPAPQTSLTTG